MEQAQSLLSPFVRVSPSANVVSENLRVVGLVVYSVIIFIFSFATASAWVAAATQAIRFEAHAKYGSYGPYDFSATHMAATGRGALNHKAQNSITKIAFIFTGVLTFVTLGLAIGFAFATKATDRAYDFSGSSSSLIQNIHKHVQESEQKTSPKVVVPVVPVLKQDQNGSAEEVADIPINISIPLPNKYR
jgi:hypothetical protein